MASKLLKIKSKGNTINEVVKCFKTLIDMANSMYWLHPEYDSKEDFLNDWLKKKYPLFDWYICVREKTIKINP